MLAGAEAAMAFLFHQGGSTSLVPDGAARRLLGGERLRLVRDLQARVKALVEADHGLAPGSLYGSGSLLTRLKSMGGDDGNDVDSDADSDASSGWFGGLLES